MKFTVPGLPIGKGRPRFGQGRTYTPAKTRRYENLIRQSYYSQMDNTQPQPMDTPICVEITAYFPIPKSISKAKMAAMDGTYRTKKPDADNLGKTILDALNGIAFVDDSVVARLTITKRYTAGEPYVEVSISSLEGATA